MSRVCLPLRGMVLLSIVSWYLGLDDLASTIRPCSNDIQEVLEELESKVYVEESIAGFEVDRGRCRVSSGVCSITKLGLVAVLDIIPWRSCCQNDSQLLRAGANAAWREFCCRRWLAAEAVYLRRQKLDLTANCLFCFNQNQSLPG